MNGIVVIDKPAGLSSARVVARVKKITGAAKVGHTGTLDPFATGVLPCCLNQATRLARFFLHGEKGYEAVLHLGTATDTQDATGQVVSRQPVPPLTAATLATVFARFEGVQMQQPPVFAALKHQGVPLYRLARQGRPVAKAPRRITIGSLRILETALPTVRFAVTCSAGTYVRTLCHDIGQMLGCGGHLAALRRTAGSGFTIAEAVSLERLEAAVNDGTWPALVLPMAEALRGLPACEVGTALIEHIRQGRPLTREALSDGALREAPAALTATPVKVVDAHGTLKAVVEASEGSDRYNYCCVFN